MLASCFRAHGIVTFNRTLAGTHSYTLGFAFLNKNKPPCVSNRKPQLCMIRVPGIECVPSYRIDVWKIGPRAHLQHLLSRTQLVFRLEGAPRSSTSIHENLTRLPCDRSHKAPCPVSARKHIHATDAIPTANSWSVCSGHGFVSGSPTPCAGSLGVKPEALTPASCTGDDGICPGGTAPNS